MNEHWANEYMRVLGVTPERPSFGFLQHICTAHLTTFPFENISKLIYFRDYETNGYRVPPPETFVQNYIQYNFGGTCYTLNANLMRLLTRLGFDCHYVMLGNEHIGILVRFPELPGEHVYVDCGAAAPIFQPVRFETNPDNVSVFGLDEVRLRREAQGEGRYQYIRFMNGQPSGKPWSFDVNQVSRFEDFQPMMDAANQPGTTFMTMLRCQLWQLDRNRSASLANNVVRFRYSNGETDKRTMSSVDEIVEVIRDEFHLPSMPVREAVQVLQDLGIDIFHE